MNHLTNSIEKNQLSVIGQFNLPTIISDLGEHASRHFVDFFTANIPNRNTRSAYVRAVSQFFNWCDRRGVQLNDIQPFMIAAYIETHSAAVPTIKQHLAAIHTLLDWMVIGQVIPFNPASSVKAPKHVVKTGKTAILTDEEVKSLFESLSEVIEDASVNGRIVALRDRAIIATLFYTFARVSAVIGLRMKDYVSLGRRRGLRLHEKGGNYLEIPTHHKLEEYLDEYIEATDIQADRNGLLFRSVNSKRELTDRQLDRTYIFRMIRRRAVKVGIPSERICCHSFRATGITNYLSHGGKLEHAQTIAGHASARTTKLYDRRNQQIELDEIERILI